MCDRPKDFRGMAGRSDFLTGCPVCTLPLKSYCHCNFTCVPIVHWEILLVRDLALVFAMEGGEGP
eukprot:5611743-Pyramimonas_sp.AAC.1